MRTFADPGALAEGAAREVASIVRDTVARRGACTVALAGGATPRGLYERLSAEPHRSEVDWSCIRVFWGDERCVPPEHPASNYAMAWESLLSQVPIPKDAVYRIRGELEPAQAAAQYEAELHLVTGEVHPRLDLVLLGMGADGHTASLFPDTPNLLEERRLVVATVGPAEPRKRVSLTLRALNAARVVLFLVQGREKASTLREVIEANTAESSSRHPAAHVRPEHGRVLWLVDRAAAVEIAAHRVDGASG
jgi:6-phosphogluconolactonase